jgi:hypothetical protein
MFNTRPEEEGKKELKDLNWDGMIMWTMTSGF